MCEQAIVVALCEQCRLQVAGQGALSQRHGLHALAGRLVTLLHSVSCWHDAHRDVTSIMAFISRPAPLTMAMDGCCVR